MIDLFTFPRLLALILLVSFSTVVAVAFTPAYPLIAEEFHLSDSQTQWMMTLFLLGSVMGRLPYGPLANAIGRKKTLYVGLTISLIGILISLCAQTYSTLILGRWIQAAGTASGMTITYTMIADCHCGPKATKALSYVMVAFAIVPGIGTSISGYLIPYMGWRGGFVFLLAFTLFLFLMCRTLPETGKGKEVVRIKHIVRDYVRGFKDSALLLHGILMGLSTALLFIFSQEAPFIATRFMKLSPEQYGVYYFIPAIGITFGSFLSAWLAGKALPQRSMIGGILLILLGSLSMVCFFSYHWYVGWALFLPQILVQIGDALLYTNASSEALSDSSNKANASAVILFLNGVCAVIGTFLVGELSPKNPMALPVVFLILIALMLAVWLFLRRQHPHSVKKT
jgi:DHA1 family 2-module integral membrane pump EmrD-like MFS transporter